MTCALTRIVLTSATAAMGALPTLRAATEELTGVRDSRYPNMAG
ncbi:hypothetical protein [Mycolicibacterium holsaticum]|nr:hypothetical protein [Mycolicibacterium holsaticum]